MRLPLALAFAAVALPTAALDLGAMTEDERAAFRAEVRDYLMADPQVLMDAIAVLQDREDQAQAQADADLVTSRLDAIADDGVSWVGGNPEGDVTIVEFMDYKCGYCRRAFQEVEDLVAGDGNIRFILKEFPILGPESELASRFAISAQRLGGPDAYKGVHDGLMMMEAEVTPESLTRLAEALGLDAGAVIAGMDAPEVAAVIAANRALADELQISGTPTFVMGDRLVRGYLALPSMEAIVAEERAG